MNKLLIFYRLMRSEAPLSFIQGGIMAVFSYVMTTDLRAVLVPRKQLTSFCLINLKK